MKIEKYILGERFLCTYGDGLSDIDIHKLFEFHSKKELTGTITAIQPLSRFGVMDIDESNNVLSFKEKPQTEGWVNGGYFVFEPNIFEYLSENSVLEKEPLQKLAAEKELSAFKHQGFWQPMDTFRESKMLNDLWESNKAPWKVGN